MFTKASMAKIGSMFSKLPVSWKIVVVILGLYALAATGVTAFFYFTGVMFSAAIFAIHVIVCAYTIVKILERHDV